MLGPALRRLFLDLGRVPESKRSAYERAVHAELADLDRRRTTDRPFKGGLGGDLMIERDIGEAGVHDLAAGSAGSAGSGRGSGDDGSFTQRTLRLSCDRYDCPNK
jgi:hypothetical protein